MPQPVTPITVTFIWNDWSHNYPVFATVNVNENGRVTQPSPPQRVDYTFTGWTRDSWGGQPFNFNEPITQDLTLYAQWEAILIDGMFLDVHPNDWFAPSALFAVNRGFMSGIPRPGTHILDFQPNTTFTRAMFVALLWNAEGAPNPMYNSWYELADRFIDIDLNNPGHWFARAVLWAYDAGLVSGFPDGSFQPNAPINRAMMATLMHNYARAKGGWYTDNPFSGNPLAAFPDAGQVPDWASDAMAWAVYNNLIAGANGMLNPTDGAPRSQAAAIMRNLVSNIITTCDRGTAEQWRYDNIISSGFVPRATR